MGVILAFKGLQCFQCYEVKQFIKPGKKINYTDLGMAIQALCQDLRHYEEKAREE